jgi:mono/diheme cytochrome c family protein
MPAVAVLVAGDLRPRGGNPQFIQRPSVRRARVLATSATNPEPPKQFATEQTIVAGMELFHRYCSGCHGGRAVSGGVLPDLRMSSLPASSEAWASVVLKGALKSNGMIGFEKELSASDAEALRAYIIDRALGEHVLQEQ